MCSYVSCASLSVRDVCLGVWWLFGDPGIGIGLGWGLGYFVELCTAMPR
jgi:hypothetical protein